MVGSPRDTSDQPTPTACQICGKKTPAAFASKNGYQLYQCRGCRFVYLDPMPSAREFSALYDDAYQGATAGYFAKTDKKLRRSRRQLARIRRKVSGGRFLDIGCNGGFTVEAAREYGFEAFGIELDPVSLAYAQSHFPTNHYFHGRIEDYPSKNPFDVVYCSEVIEHVADANGFLSATARLMRPGALLYLTTPDISHWRRPQDINEWDAFCPPAHCLYFNPLNLTTILARHGLRVIRRRWAWKPGIKLYACRTP
ncbi:MAG: methyltransferase domain-containing protein [Alphaproteobacteria bacterium]